MNAPLTHPAWCAAAECTAVVAEAPADCSGQHRSTAVELDMRPVWFEPYTDVRTTATARLYQLAMPWTCETFLNIKFGPVRISIPASSAGSLLGQLLGLTSAAADERSTERDDPDRQENDHEP